MAKKLIIHNRLFFYVSGPLGFFSRIKTAGVCCSWNVVFNRVFGRTVYWGGPEGTGFDKGLSIYKRILPLLVPSSFGVTIFFLYKKKNKLVVTVEYLFNRKKQNLKAYLLKHFIVIYSLTLLPVLEMRPLDT